MSTRITPTLPDPALAWLQGGAPALLLTADDEGYPGAAFAWAAARDAGRIRCGADHGSATLANLERTGKAALQLMGPDGLLYIARGSGCVVKEQLAAAPLPISIAEVAIADVKDQSWPGVVVAPLSFEWPPEQKEELLALEQAVYAELREWSEAE